MWMVERIEEANRAAGQYFFEADTKRFFRSRTLQGTHEGPGGVFFVTSEKAGFEDRTRVRTIRVFIPATGEVATACEEKFATTYQAKKAATELAAGTRKCTCCFCKYRDGPQDLGHLSRKKGDG